MSARPRYQWGHAKPTTCVHGHEYTQDNTRLVTNDTGREQRRCRICERAAGRASKRRRKQQRSAA